MCIHRNNYISPTRFYNLNINQFQSKVYIHTYACTPYTAIANLSSIYIRLCERIKYKQKHVPVYVYINSTNSFPINTVINIAYGKYKNHSSSLNKRHGSYIQFLLHVSICILFFHIILYIYIELKLPILYACMYFVCIYVCMYLALK